VTRAPLAALALVLLASGGCASAASRIATAQNAWDYGHSRFMERCVEAPAPAGCADAVLLLRGMRSHLDDAVKAADLGRDGASKEQLAMIAADQKALKALAVLK
jgi:hypothetical protein